ncbi:MAG: tautomerase family protein [candidate division Zixibacteria bacterium]|nr:tautomerase family protein [candidate division Zixibacteria bacterium]
MPCLEITMPQTTAETKTALAEKLTIIFSEATGMGADIFAIHFNEYNSGEVSIGGKIWNGGESRPYLHFMLYCPRLKRSVKQIIIKKMTLAFAESVGNPDWKPVIHIDEHPYDNVGVEGKLLSDAYEACAKAEFYYSLPKD